MIKKIKEDENFVVFESISGETFLYERIFNTIHSIKSPEELDRLEDALKKENRDFSFKVDPDKAKDKLDNLETLVLNITESCNLRCDYCIYSGDYDTERTHNSKSMDKETAEKAIDIFMERATDSPIISFYGGEPLVMQKEITQIVKYIASKHTDKKVNYCLTTNFTLAADMLEFMVQNNFLINISLDGPKELHDRHRRTKGDRPTFEDIKNNLTRLKNKHQEYFDTHVSFSITISEPSSIEEVRQFFNDNFPNNPLTVQPVEKRFCKGCRAQASQEERAKAAQQMEQMVKTYADNIVNGKDNDMFLRALFDTPSYMIRSRGNNELPETLWPRGVCVPGARKLFVNTNGRFYMCEKIGERLDIGSVDEGLDTQKVLSALESYVEIKNYLCKPCWAARLCDSCAVSAKDIEGISTNGQLKSCNPLKDKILRGMGIYAHVFSRNPVNAAGYFQKLEEGMKNANTI
jgi:uncharacterized protein